MSLLDLLLVPACGGCGRPRGVLCSDCTAALRAPSRSQDRFVVADSGVVVGDALLLAMAAYAYAGPMRTALASLKYRGVSRLARPLATAALPRLAELLTITGPAELVPVPVHPERRRERGYNQAELLASELARLTRCRVHGCLARGRATTKQHRLNRSARLRNLRDAFVVSRLPPERAIIVDDIITTSATLEAGASVLASAGCREVYGFAIARVV
jgi:ComF family protein